MVGWGVLAGAGAGVTAIVAAPVLLLGAGFTAGGVAAGSAAAAIQGAVYGGTVAAGSAFALAQSAGVLGMAATTKLCLGGAVGGATTLIMKALGK